MCISWAIKCLILLMHGATMKFSYRRIREDCYLHLQDERSINILKMMNNGCRFSETPVTNYNSKRPIPKGKGFNLYHKDCISLGSRTIKLFIHHTNTIRGYTRKYQNAVVKFHRPAAIDTALNLPVTLQAKYLLTNPDTIP